jgi:hypothetical protein
MANFSLEDLADSAGNATGDFLRDAANQAANFACGLYKNYPGWSIVGDPLGVGAFNKALWDNLCSPPGRPGLPDPPPPPSFLGGQCEVIYNFYINVNGAERKMWRAPYSNDAELPGRIVSIQFQGCGGPSFGQYNNNYWLATNDKNQTTSLHNFTPFTETCVPIGNPYPKPKDAQPDNCGNPPSGYPKTAPPPEALTQNITINNNNQNISFPVTFNSNPKINIPISVKVTDPKNNQNFNINFNFDGVHFDFGGGSKGEGGGTTPDSDNVKETKDKVTAASEDIKKISEALQLDLTGIINAKPCGKSIIEYKYSGKTFLGLQAQINSLANMLARVHEDVCLIGFSTGDNTNPTALIERIYQILGGNAWFNQTQTPALKTKGEDAIKNLGVTIFGQEGDQLNEVTCTSLIDLLRVNTAVNYYRLGLQELPATLPSSLITKYGDLNNILPNPETKLNSYIKLFGWYIERFDEVLGQWEVAIEIKDTDPTTPGDQSKVMKFPNAAELLAEMVMLLLQISINSELLTNLSTRILMEAGQDKQQNFITYKLLQSLTDYFGYDYKEVPKEMPLLFDPKATEFDKMLTEVKIKVAAPEYNEKFNFQADLMRLKKAAAIVESNQFVKINPNANIKEQLMKRIFKLRDLLNDINENADTEDLKEFLDHVEKGFTDTPGVGDPTKPYGKDYEDRPRFKDFNNQSE